ncbi:MAG TPA: Asp-tRNA(Asn)/Glu-tRNA(Gln) amidotransferase subunit GatB [Candidatus Paceibacterota bacterium]|nr:Asp-tRNA(Asn)/Glu-tRNA(Gln) amidotransferase subunit GatB [Candidatus Paceibacterota bacterium]
MEKTYYPTIGLEIHAELKTDSKMFCGCKNDPNEEKQNTNICPICMGHPGTLPFPNKQAIENVIKVGLALGSDIANFTEFDRKNYFYPDIPKGYQISQYKYPIVSGGSLNGKTITRIHLEEDTGLSKHDRGNFTLVDFNRAGVPLMEMVTEPVIHSAKEAGDFARELQLLLRTLGVSEANMEKGEMRVEPNISISPDPNKFGTKVEVKNLNSFKAVEKAIEYELARMQALYEAGREDEIVQETRGWDENKQTTFSQRSKENANDYRYFPDPDIPKFMLNEMFDMDALKLSLPELPWQKRERYQKDFGLGEELETFVVDGELSKYFETVARNLPNLDQIKTASNYILSDMLGNLKKDSSLRMPSPENFAILVGMIAGGEITSRGAKDILAMIMKEDADPKSIAEKEGLLQQNDEETIRTLAQKIISENQNLVDQYRAGKESIAQAFVGTVMKETKGSANPQVTLKILKEELQK